MSDKNEDNNNNNSSSDDSGNNSNNYQIPERDTNTRIDKEEKR